MDFTQAETDSIDSAKKAVAEMLTVSSRVEWDKSYTDTNAINYMYREWERD